MFDPTALNGTIAGLREDATQLREQQNALKDALAAVEWTGPKADAFRAHMAERLSGFDRHAMRLDEIASSVGQLQKEVQTELLYLQRIEDAFRAFVRDARASLQTAISAAGSVISSAHHVLQSAVSATEGAGDAVTGNIKAAKHRMSEANSRLAAATQDLQAIEALFNKHGSLPRGHTGWRAADADARRHSGLGGIGYRAPSR